MNVNIILGEGVRDYTDRQRQIIQTSLTIVGERGMHNLTIRNIAKNLSVTEPAVYRHFESKHAILVGMLDFLQGNITPHFALLKMSSQETGTFFTSFLTALFTTIENNPSYALFIFSEEVFHSDEAMKPYLSSLLDQMFSNLEHLCLEIKNKKNVRADLSASDMALIILSTIRITVTRWNVNKETSSLMAEVEDLNRLLCTILFTA